jgi:zinc/manganese transport system substrate-binding protein
MSPRRAVLPALAISLAVALGATACGGGPTSGGAGSGSDSGPGGERASVVVTYPVLAAVVRQVVGTGADVTVLMPNGADPHEWNPSAKDIQALLGADLVVANGLGLEGHLQDPLTQAKSKGVAVFTATDHVTVRKVRAGEGAEADDPDQAPGADDPHIWTDPLTMRQWVTALVPALKAVGVDATAGAARAQADLDTLHAELTTVLATIPDQRRELVTGHESLGYLAERYRFRLIGAVVPSTSSQDEASAGELAQLTRKVKDAGAPAVFTELGTPAATARAVARDTGAKVVQLSTHVLPADGTYRTFMLDLANTIAGALR